MYNKSYNKQIAIRRRVWGKTKTRPAQRRGQMQADLSRYGRESWTEEMRQASGRRITPSPRWGAHHARRHDEPAICYVLKKLRIKTDIPAVVTGSLCHDLGILGRGGKFHSSKECSRQHPVESVKVAHKLTGSCPKKRKRSSPATCGPSGKAKPPTPWRPPSFPPRGQDRRCRGFCRRLREKQPGLKGHYP